jgi:hypothetical protein
MFVGFGLGGGGAGVVEHYQGIARENRYEGVGFPCGNRDISLFQESRLRGDGSGSGWSLCVLAYPWDLDVFGRDDHMLACSDSQRGILPGEALWGGVR